MRRMFTVILLIGSLVFVGSNAVLAKRGGNGNGNSGGNSGGRSSEHRNDGNRGGNGGGGGGGGNRSGITEDNDSDGVRNNIPDDGDNRHPSGRDRSVENGNSGNQGNSQSDPDGMSNGGADKPGGSGGIDQLDQDGNNGCGNDDDFEDDNNGNCGGNKPADVVNQPDAVTAPPDAAVVPEARDLFAPNGSLPQIFVPDPVSAPNSAIVAPVIARAVPDAVDSGGTGVLNRVEELGSDVASAIYSVGKGTLGSMGGWLPRTGMAIALLVGLALAAIGGGTALRSWAQRRSASVPDAPAKDDELIAA
jgi:hypothetical protein